MVKSTPLTAAIAILAGEVSSLELHPPPLVRLSFPAPVAGRPTLRKLIFATPAVCLSTRGADAKPELSAPSFLGSPRGFWIRAVAAIIDALCLAAVEFMLIVIAPGISLDIYLDSGAIWGTGTWVDFVTLLTGITYYTVGVSVWATTIGKRAVGLYVLRPDGSKLGPGRAFARYWAPILSALILFIGFLMVAFREDKRALHDLICDTVVVKR